MASAVSFFCYSQISHLSLNVPTLHALSRQNVFIRETPCLCVSVVEFLQICQ